MSKMKKNIKYLIGVFFVVLIAGITLTALFSFCTTSHFKEKAKIVEKYCKHNKYDVLYLNDFAYACITKNSGLIKYEQIRGYYE